MTVCDLKIELNDLPDDMEVVIFHGGISISPDIENVIVIDDELLYDDTVLEIGCGW